MSVCAWKFFDCGSGLNGDVMEARDRGECFAAVEGGDLFSVGRIREIVGDGTLCITGDAKANELCVCCREEL